MKLRIRFGKRTEKVEASGTDSIELLKQKIAACFGIPPDSFELSLNGRDAINEESNSPISALGLVSGDLLKLINDAGSRTDVTRGSGSSHSQGEPPSAPSNQGTETGTESNECHPGTSSSTLTQGATSSPTTGPVEDKSPVQGSEVGQERSNEPMFIRDCVKDRVPLRLRELWRTNRPQSAEETLSLVLHVLMLETGFVIHSRDEFANPSTALPSAWREGGCCRLSYVHQQCDSSHVCHMACVPLGTVVVVTGVISHDQNCSFSLQLTSTEYVKEWVQGLTLCNTAKLSRIFKDTIAHPVVHKIRENCRLPPLHGLLALAAEIQIKIMAYLDVRSILNLSEVCHVLHELTQDEALWRHLCLRDLKAVHSWGTGSSWKNTYKRVYSEERERARAEEEWRRQAMERWRHPHFVPDFPGQHQFPGIRGGDYDLDPFAANPLRMPRPNPLHPQGMRPRRDPIFPDGDLDPQPGPGRGLTDGSSRRGLREGLPGSRRIGFGGRGGFFM